MANKYDVVVIGAGHNGLTAATIAAKRGRKVLVLERRALAGGLCAGDEFHPGFRSPGILHDTTALRNWVVEELDLVKHGLTLRKDEAPVFVPQRKGKGILLWRSLERMTEELAPLSERDARSYKDYRLAVERVAPVVRRVFDEFPPEVAGMSFHGLWDLMKTAVTLRMLGKGDMMEILRVAPMCVADYLNEWFQTDALKAGLCGPALTASYTGPWSPGTAANLLLAEAFARPGVVGGPQALAKALVKAATTAGVEVRTNAQVQRVQIEKGRATGVVLADGSVVQADVIAASCDPKSLFLKLIDPVLLPMALEREVFNVRARGTTAKLELAVDRLPEWRERPSLKAEYIRTGEHFDDIERAFDFVKYRQHSTEPTLDIYVPTLEAPELAPSGKHVVSILAHFVPCDVEGGWTDQSRKGLYETVLKTIEQYAPGIRGSIVGHRLLTPKDLEDQWGLSGGHLYHGEHAADQLIVRPVPSCSRYATPFQGLFLCGSGGHPGGGVTCAPGALSARAFLG